MPASRSSSSSISNDNTNNNDGDDSQVLLELMSPDGYYRYLGVTKPSSMSTAADITSSAASSSKSTSTSTSSGGGGGTAEKDAVSKEQKEFLDAVKKSYRKLSLKHHPDKSGGHVDTFRLLNRAQRVLLDTNLRKQYDLLGIDLDDDESLDQNNNSSSSSNGGDENATNDSAEKDEKDHRGSASQGVLQEIASNVLAVILQLGVRTSTLHVGWP